MIQILKYLFSKMHFFYGKVLGIKHNTFLYPSAVIGLLFAFNWVVVISLVLLYIDRPINALINYWIVGGVIIVGAVVLYMWVGGRYRKVLDDVGHYSKFKKEKLRRYSLIYVSISIISAVLIMYFVQV